MRRSRLLLGTGCLIASGVYYFFGSGGAPPEPDVVSPIDPREASSQNESVRLTSIVKTPVPTVQSVNQLEKQPPKRRRLKKSQKEFLRRAHLAPNRDLVRECEDGEHNTERYIAARDYLLSLGDSKEDAEWRAAIATIFGTGDEAAFERWKLEAKKSRDELAAKALPPLTSDDFDVLRLSGSDSGAALVSLLDSDAPHTTLSQKIASLLPDDRFLDSPDSIREIQEFAPHSAWGPVLAAKAAIERGDWIEAEQLTRDILGLEMEPQSLGLRDALSRFLMEERGYGHQATSRWMEDGLDSDSLSRHSLDLARQFYDQARTMKGNGDDDWIALAANGLALAEAGTEIHTEDGLHAQDDLLNLLGKDRAQAFLNEPYDQLRAEISLQIPQARSDAVRAWELTNSLRGDQLLEFNRLRMTLGPGPALESFGEK